MKNLIYVLHFMISMGAIQAEVITLLWKGSADTKRKFVAIPAGKICKIFTITSSFDWGFLDGNTEVLINDNFNSQLGNSKLIAGPAKLFFKRGGDSASINSFITLEIFDQNTPKSGVTFTDY